jgi:hypothetical protein
MLYVVYIPKSIQNDRDTLVAVFLMEFDAREFVKKSSLTLQITTSNAWNDWTGIRNKAFNNSEANV